MQDKDLWDDEIPMTVKPITENHTLKKASPTKMDFSAVLASSAHDMKNSLGMLLNTVADMVVEIPPKNSHQKKYYSVIEYEAARINNELIQLLSLYRMDEERLIFLVEENYVMDLLEEQVARNAQVFAMRDIAIEINCDVDLCWYYDAEMLSGVINNLLVNCARYSKQKVIVSARVQNSYLVIAVCDDGQGYPNEMLRDASSPMSVSFTSGNTRLGLVFARRVLHMHKVRDRHGFLRLTNGGDLGGGMAELHLP